LVICGTKDRLLQPENSKIFPYRIANTELAMIENTGHGFFTDSPEESSKIILRFLSEHSDKPSNI
jgi:pimeloyl-ACP methyl ester carboxylesterase